MKNRSNVFPLALVFALAFSMSCSTEGENKYCPFDNLYVSIAYHAISPPLVTEFTLDSRGEYWIYRNVEKFDTIQGYLGESDLSVVRQMSREVDLLPQEDIVSDAGVYQLKLVCPNGDIRAASYEGLTTLPDDTKKFISDLEALINKLGRSTHKGNN